MQSIFHLLVISNIWKKVGKKRINYGFVWHIFFWKIRCTLKSIMWSLRGLQHAKISPTQFTQLICAFIVTLSDTIEEYLFLASCMWRQFDDAYACLSNQRFRIMSNWRTRRPTGFTFYVCVQRWQIYPKRWGGIFAGHWNLEECIKIMIWAYDSLVARISTISLPSQVPRPKLINGVSPLRMRLQLWVTNSQLKCRGK